MLFRQVCVLGALFSTMALGATDSKWLTALSLAREEAKGAANSEEAEVNARRAGVTFQDRFPVQWDWMMQDSGEEPWRVFLPKPEAELEIRMVRKALNEPGLNPKAFEGRLDALLRTKAAAKELLQLYAAVCEQRRELRLRTVLEKAPRIAFTKKRTIRPSFFAYTEGQSDAQNERHFLPGSELCLLEFDTTKERGTSSYGTVRVLLEDKTGAIRDPAVSWDAKRVVFAWKKSLNEDDYHLYEYDVEPGKLRQLTFGLGFADYEPTFLPDGDLIFASTRCVQTVDCWWTEVSNLYRCNANGDYLRRVGVDQVHSIYPQVLDDGRIVYTRWDYNDRGQIFPQPLFQMNMDGTAQSEFYGNSSWFPTTIAHARGIPGTQKVLAILCGHHSSQAGKLAVIDPSKGRQESSGVQLVAPVRETPAERIDSYGQEGELWQYPFPLNEREYITGYAPLGWDQPERRRGDADFGIYWMDVDGRRELLAWDKRMPCSQPVALVERTKPSVRPSDVNYAQDRGTYYMQDVYSGAGLSGVARGTVKKVRVVALEFRAAGVGYNGSGGPGGGALVSTPVAIGNGTWDVKKVLGEATVHEDGSAYFTVPSRTPVYFQALDQRGFAVQTMRTWSTLQPGERFGCAGCHDPRNAAAPALPAEGVSLALKAGPEHLGGGAGFSFVKRVQPILDRHCVGCHNDREPLLKQMRGGSPVLGARRSTHSTSPAAATDEKAFTLLGVENLDVVAKRKWSDAYLVLTQARPDGNDETRGAFKGHAGGRVVNWITSQSVPEPLPPLSGGAVRSELMSLLAHGHKGVKLSRDELTAVACWIDLLVPYCGDYMEANTWTPEEMQKYERFAAKRRAMENLERENIRALVKAQGKQ